MTVQCLSKQTTCQKIYGNIYHRVYIVTLKQQITNVLVAYS